MRASHIDDTRRVPWELHLSQRYAALYMVSIGQGYMNNPSMPGCAFATHSKIRQCGMCIQKSMDVPHEMGSVTHVGLTRWCGECEDLQAIHTQLLF